MDSETRFRPSAKTGPRQCANGCGFFGKESTMNLCSKCFKDHLLGSGPGSSSSAQAAVNNKSLNLLSTTSEPKVGNGEDQLKRKEVSSLNTDNNSNNRCGCCSKKVGVVGFKCKCGVTFCGSHRYPEEHDCTYDYKVAGRAYLAKANPLVVANKLQKI